MSAARRLTLRTLVSLGAVACVLAVCGARAEAATAPVVEGESVADVAASSATLQAQINPGGAETTYRFEYGTAEGVYSKSVPVPDGVVGAGESGLEASAHVQGLSPGTVYHYRVVAVNEFQSVDGADQVFTTQPAVATFGLPDDRQYELVTPPNKHGAEAEVVDRSDAPQQAAEDGGAVTYAMRIPSELESPANPPDGSNMLSIRGSAGWVTQDITPPLAEPVGPEAGGRNEFYAFSPDLSHSILAREGSFGRTGNVQILSSEVPENAGEDVFLRTDGVFQPLVTKPAPAGAGAHFFDATPDLNHIILDSGTALTPGSSHGVPNFYEWTDGRLQLINVLPSGEEAVGCCGSEEVTIGNEESYNTDHAVSEDGTRVIWSYPSEGGGVKLYERDILAGETIDVGSEAAAHSGSARPEDEFQTASSNGLKIFSTDNAQGRGEGVSDLYEYEVEDRKLNDLASNGEVQGILGDSKDGTYVYFVGRGVLRGSEGQGLRNVKGKEPVAGGDNLYMSHEEGSTWTPEFIATLESSDLSDWARSRSPAAGGGLSRVRARVSPDGEFLAFMSKASLTGYDNTNVSCEEGKCDEVYEYDSASGSLVCASCNPTGARPLSGSEVPLWVGVGSSGEKAYYQPRYLSDEGRLFFNSSDALVVQDTNGQQDVYEYEPAGVGSCVGPGACLGLISSGRSGLPSSFVDASASGEDVFFVTRDQLVSQDVDEAYDMYDAHDCAGKVSCPPLAVAAVPSCASSDACKPGPTPQPAIFGAPPSATFVGAGNAVAAEVKPAEKTKPKTRKPKPRKVHKYSKQRKKSRGHSNKGGR